MDIALNKVIRIGLLYDFYNSLLTEKQIECLNMHYLQDLSLAEIAEQSGTSRQAVHDILRRAEQTLEEYEEKLGLLKRYQEEIRLLREMDALMNCLPEDIKEHSEIKKISGKLEEFNFLLGDFREV